MTNDELRAYVEAKRGRPLSMAERNIDISALNRDLNDGKEKIRAAIADEQARQIRRWAAGGMRGSPRVRPTPAILKVLEELYAAGEKHGEAELRKAGYRGYAAAGGRKRLNALKAQLTTYLGSLNQRLRKKTTELDLGTLSRAAIVDSLSRVPGALDVASRMISQTVYAGLGAAFDRASGQVDAEQGGGGGNGWEQTAVMDGGTCDPCAEADGTVYDTWEQAQDTMPDGGPYVDCDGETRCRCRLAPVPL